MHAGDVGNTFDSLPSGRGLMSTALSVRLLKITPQVIRSWEMQYGFPAPRARLNGRNGYVYEEVLLLAHHLDGSSSIAGAIRKTVAELNLRDPRR